jgi:hypothetical protein
MKFLRNIEGETSWNIKRNETSREEVAIQDLLAQLQEKQMQWFGHFNQLHNVTI